MWKWFKLTIYKICNDLKWTIKRFAVLIIKCTNGTPVFYKVHFLKNQMDKISDKKRSQVKQQQTTQAITV